MKWFLIILAVLLIINQIQINIDIIGTVWIEKSTSRPIYIISYDREDGIRYYYAGEPFERHMRLIDLIKNFKYNGTG